MKTDRLREAASPAGQQRADRQRGVRREQLRPAEDHEGHVG